MSTIEKMAHHDEDIIHMGLMTCEICGINTPETTLCSGCQEWVEHYAETLQPSWSACRWRKLATDCAD